MSNGNLPFSGVSSSRATFSVLLSVVFLDNLGFAIVVPYLYFYVLSLGGSTFLYGVLLASYSLMSFIFTPTIARLSDRFGRRKILLAALAVASLSYFIFGAAQAVWLLFLGRMLSGTTAATVPVAQAYVADVTTKNIRLRYLGLLGAAAGLAFIFGPAIGGTLSGLFGYAVPSFLASALAFTNLVLAYFLLPEPASFNIKKTVVSFSALVGILKQRKVVLLLAQYFMFFISFVFLQASISPWLQTVFGFGSLETGLIFFYLGVVSVTTQAALLPMLSKRLGRFAIISLGIGFFIIGLFALSVASSLAVLLIVAAIAAFGYGIQYVALNTLISINTPESAQGGALGVAWAIAGLAQALAPVLAASAFSFGVSVGFVGLVFVLSALISLATTPMIAMFKKIAAEKT
ncbi:MAG: MFS transporter [Candidatus Bathyarchaeota archaeon]|nr:MFS transporter [Candidatus Bathyarchaeota archaeon]